MMSQFLYFSKYITSTIKTGIQQFIFLDNVFGFSLIGSDICSLFFSLLNAIDNLFDVQHISILDAKIVLYQEMAAQTVTNQVLFSFSLIYYWIV